MLWIDSDPNAGLNTPRDGDVATADVAWHPNCRYQLLRDQRHSCQLRSFIDQDQKFVASIPTHRVLTPRTLHEPSGNYL
jgi:hypothetical protein